MLDAVPPDHRALILTELKRRSPNLIKELAHAERPTSDQSDAIIDVWGSPVPSPWHEFDVLEKLFFAVDDYVADPGLRRQVGGLDDEQLRSRARAVRAELYGD